ncbi:MAG: ABC transporter ATP-binding protein [Methanocella sp.]
MPGIRIQGLTKRFGKTAAVRDLSLEIKEGEFISLLGPSVCGKTTVLRSLAGLETPDEGSIAIGDDEVFSATRGYSAPPGSRGIGMVFQSYALWPHLSVGANVTFGLEIAGVGREQQRERLTQALRLVGIEDLAARYPSELSGGQQQRVALARAIVTEPKLLLLDEPLSNLDAKLRLQMRSELQRLHRQLGCTVVYVTHDQVEAMTLSSRVVLLRQGVLQQVDAPRTIYRQPANAWVADFMGNPSINLLRGEVVGDGTIGRLDCGATLPLPSRGFQPGLRIKVGVRPEDVTLAAEGETPALSGRVHSVQLLGNETLVQVSVGGEVLTLRAPGESEWEIDREVGLRVEPRKVLVFDAESGRLI